MVDTDAIARGFLAAHDAGEPYGPPTATAALTVDDANSVQRTFVALRSINDKLIGYKAAANAAALQKALNLLIIASIMTWQRQTEAQRRTVLLGGEHQ